MTSLLRHSLLFDRVVRDLLLPGFCLASLLFAWPACASSEQQRIYRCGNAYTNQPDPAANCKPLAGGSVTVIEGTRVQGASVASPQVNASGGTSAGSAKVDSASSVNATHRRKLCCKLNCKKHSSNMPGCSASGTTVSLNVAPMSSVNRKNTKTVSRSYAVHCNAQRLIWQAAARVITLVGPRSNWKQTMTLQVIQSNYAQAFDLLATLVAVVRTDGVVVFANAALEDVMGVSRRTIEGSAMASYFNETQSFENALQGAQTNAFATMRYDAQLRRPLQDPMPVHVIVAPTDVAGEVLVELLPLELQTRQDREERLIDQAQANKELIRNLAHEIKNPLGGIRETSCCRWRWKAKTSSNTPKSSSTKPSFASVGRPSVDRIAVRMWWVTSAIRN